MEQDSQRVRRTANEGKSGGNQRFIHRLSVNTKLIWKNGLWGGESCGLDWLTTEVAVGTMKEAQRVLCGFQLGDPCLKPEECRANGSWKPNHSQQLILRRSIAYDLSIMPGCSYREDDRIRMMIYETDNFVVSAAKHPHIDRSDGGHIKITPKIRVCDRTALSPELAAELMLLTQVVGKAMITELNRRGVDVGRINYQENGNWGVFDPEGPYLHIHLYGRAKSAVTQEYGAALHLPHRETSFYDKLTPLDPMDIEAIREEIARLFAG